MWFVFILSRYILIKLRFIINFLGYGGRGRKIQGRAAGRQGGSKPENRCRSGGAQPGPWAPPQATNSTGSIPAGGWGWGGALGACHDQQVRCQCQPTSCPCWCHNRSLWCATGLRPSHQLIPLCCPLPPDISTMGSLCQEEESGCHACPGASSPSSSPSSRPPSPWRGCSPGHYPLIFHLWVYGNQVVLFNHLSLFLHLIPCFTQKSHFTLIRFHC